jgi:hypothetical protein
LLVDGHTFDHDDHLVHIANIERNVGIVNNELSVLVIKTSLASMLH